MKKSNRLRDRKPRSGRQKKRGIVAVLVLLALVLAQFSSTGLTASVQAADEDEAVEATAQTKDDTLDVTIDDEVVAEESETEEESPAAVEDEKGEKSEAETEDETPEEEDDEDDEEAATFKVTKGGVTVTVEAPAGALPEDAKLQVKRYDEDSSEYKEAAEAIDFDENESGMAALDISFTVDGEEVEPEEAVKVSIDASKILPDDADASTLEVQHLKEGRAGQVRAEVVANDSSSTEGTINETKKTAEFEVESFSVFTVEWNDDSETSIEVHIYSINGTSVDEELDEDSALIANNGTITIQDLVDHLESNADYTNEYTFRYAMIVYQVAQQPSGYAMTKIGSEGNSVTSINKSGTTYTIYQDGTTSTISDPDSIVIRLYYSVPEVTISTGNAHESEVTFTTSSSYFNGNTEEATYTWTLSDDSEGTITNNNDGTATFTWGSNAQAGDKETVTVTMTVGDETASDTYTLTYGDQQVTITVYANGTTTGQANAHVALVDADGNTVATGTTDENGEVTLYAPEGSYTVGVTYVVQSSTTGGGSTSRYTAEGEVVVNENGTLTGDTTLTLGTAITSGPGGDTNGTNGTAIDGVYYYEHIDVKVAVAETEESEATFSDLDAVYVYDKYGNLIYSSDDLNQNPGTTDYNCLFDINGAEDTHSIVVSSEDTIVIVYEIYEDGEYKTYTATYTGGGTYKSDDYYPYNSINAYQLWNQLYGATAGTTYASQEAFEAAWTSGQITVGVNENGIAIGGYTYTLIADYLCDTRTTSGQAGLDFVIDVMDAVFEEYDIQIAKTYNTPVTFTENDLEAFNFTLQQIDKVTASDDDQEGVWDTNEDNAVGEPTDGETTNWSGGNGVWTSIIDLENILTYEAEDGTNTYYYVLSEGASATSTAETQYVGIKITVTYTASTGQTDISASYCALETTDTDGVYNKAGSWTGLELQEGTDDNGDSYYYYEIPFVNTYSTTGFELEKVNENGELLGGAIFNISLNETTLFFTYDSDNNVYTLSTESTEGATDSIAVAGGGPVRIEGITAGTYTLSEIVPPAGYASIGDFTVTIDDEGTINVTGTNVSVEDDTVTVENDLETYGFTLTKTDGSTQLDGATFNLCTDEEGTEILTFTYDADSNTYTVDVEGTITDLTVGSADINGLTAGTYYLVETEAPSGYEELTGAITVTIASDGTFTVSGDNASYSDGTLTVANDELTFSFTLAKVDDNGEALNGAGFTMKDSDGTTLYFTSSTEEGVTIYTLDSDSTISEIAVTNGGPVTIEGLVAGTYTMSETTTPIGYDEIDDFTVTIASDGTVTVSGENVNVDDTLVTVTNSETTIDISGTKIWVDSDNGYNTRPASITIHLFADGTEVDSVTVTSSDTSNTWTWSFTDLPMYNSSGEEIKYTITENAVPGYTTDISDFTVTNTMETVNIEGSKTWTDDSDNKYSTRPNSITIHLLADGTEVDNMTVTSNDDWKWSFTDLPKYQSDGTTEIKYTITEDAVPGYTTEVKDYDVTNTLQTTEVSGEKTWVDEDNANDTRPDSITIYLYADGVQTGDTAVVTSSDNWAWKFTDLPMYQSDGTTEIVYTIMEGETEEGHLGEYIPSYSDDGLSVTNAIPEVHKFVSDVDFGESTDDELHEDEADNNNTLEYKMEADHIGSAQNLVLHDWLDDQLDMSTLTIKSVTLYTSEDDTGTLLSEGTDYTVTTGECSADCGLDGCSFEIHVEDDDLEGLSSDAYVIVIFDIDVKEGVEDFDSNYVDEIDNFVGLSFFSYYATPDETETYSYGFDLYKYDEDTNEPLADVEFVMSNSNGQYAQFDDSDGAYLLTGWVDSKGDATAIVSGSDGQAVVEGLHDGTFNIEETKTPEGYQQVKGTFTVTITVDEDDPHNPTITATNATYADGEVQISNTQGSEDTVSIIGAKTWDDSNDADGVRPDSITIRLYADGTEVDSKKVTAEDGWAWRFSNLDKYQSDGTTEINYTITEDAVSDYDTTYYDENYNVTNTHTPETPEPGTPGPGPAQPNPGNGGNGGPGTVKTSDTNNIGLWLFLLIAAAAVIAGSVFVRIRRYRY